MDPSEYRKKAGEVGTDLAKQSYDTIAEMYRKQRERVKRQKNRLKKAGLNNESYTNRLEAKLSKTPTIQSIEKKVASGKLTKAQARNMMIKAVKPLITTQWAESYTVKGARAQQAREVATMEKADAAWYLEQSTDEKAQFWNMYHYMRDTGVITQTSDPKAWEDPNSAINKFQKWYNKNNISNIDLSNELIEAKEADFKGEEYTGKKLERIRKQYSEYLEKMEQKELTEYKERRGKENAVREDDEFGADRFLRVDERNWW